MRLPTLKNRFLIFNLIAIASFSSSILTSCATANSQNQSQAQEHHGGGMHHNMTMDLGPADANYDLRFIDAMIPHHQGAIVMAKEALQKSTHPEIKKLANDIIKAQNQEINQMKQWRTAWYPKAGDKPMAYDSNMGHTMEMSSEQMQAMMMNMDLGAADKDFDLRFINAMIPHHEAAVVMAKDVLKKSQRAEVKKLAQAIIKAQDAEINQMKKWRTAWYGKNS